MLDNENHEDVFTKKLYENAANIRAALSKVYDVFLGMRHGDTHGYIDDKTKTKDELITAIEKALLEIFEDCKVDIDLL